jgi:hypothetical protein
VTLEQVAADFGVHGVTLGWVGGGAAGAVFRSRTWGGWSGM